MILVVPRNKRRRKALMCDAGVQECSDVTGAGGHVTV